MGPIALTTATYNQPCGAAYVRSRFGTADRIGNGGISGSERLFPSLRGVLGSLMLNLRVQFGAQQNDNRRHPHPYH